jgi:SNF2 family DNA or RNA helicase
VQDQLGLPSRIEKVHQIDLSDEERKIYDFFKSRASSLVGKFSQKSQMDKTSWRSMLSIIGFLRSICNHGQLLPPAAIEMYNKQNISTVDSLLKTTPLPEVSTSSSGLSIDLVSGSPESAMDLDNSGRTGYQPSSKIHALIQNIQNEQLGNLSTYDGIPRKR